MFVGREAELTKLENAMSAGEGVRVAVVAVQGMAGVGKSFLVEQFCAKQHERFSAIHRWVLDPAQPATVEQGLWELARQAGFDVGRIPSRELALALNERELLVHIDNVDGPAAAEVVADLLRDLPNRPAIVTGRYLALGTTPGGRWQRVEVECLDLETSVALLRKELVDQAPGEGELCTLASELGGLPLALHLAAGYLRLGYTAEDFLRELRAERLALRPADAADPIAQERSRGIIAAAFEISKKLFLAEAAKRGRAWEAALGALGWAPLAGFGRSLGAAIVGISSEEIGPFLLCATGLSLLRRIPGARRSEDTWSVHPLVAEFLRMGHAREAVDERIAAWVVEHGDGHHEHRRERWTALSRESAAVHAWLAEVDASILMVVLPQCWEYGVSCGSARQWLDAARRGCQSPRRRELAWAWGQLARHVGDPMEALLAAEILRKEGDARQRGLASSLIADVLIGRGESDKALRILQEEALPIFDELGDVQSKAVAMTKISSISAARGGYGKGLRKMQDEVLPLIEQLGDRRLKAIALGDVAELLTMQGWFSEALSLLRQEVLPIYESLGDVRSGAVMLTRISDILEEKGEISAALQILCNEAMPVFDRLGDMRNKAIVRDKIAGIVMLRGEFDEALRICREEVLPIFEVLGAAREWAVTIGRIADILEARGEPDEALRIRREQALPVFVRLGDVREAAVMMGKVADVLEDRGQLDEALRIRRDEELPVFERLGANLDKALTSSKIADILCQQGNWQEALRIHQEEVLPVYEQMGDVRSIAVTKGNIADILVTAGDIEEGMRTLTTEVLPVHKRIGDMQATAVTIDKIIDILAIRGEFEEALRLSQEEALPLCERLGGRDLMAGLANFAVLLIRRGHLSDFPKARRYLQRAAQMAQQMGIPFPEEHLQWLASEAGRT